jgi:hypothetical protein
MKQRPDGLLLLPQCCMLQRDKHIMLHPEQEVTASDHGVLVSASGQVHTV